MHNNYFYIDGSALLSDIKKQTEVKAHLKGKKFNPIIFCKIFQGSQSLRKFHENAYNRIVFYFVKNDPRIKKLIKIPDFRVPGLIEDIEIKYCGKRIPIYKKAADWLEEKRAPHYVTDSLYKSEKAVDTQICCDAFFLLALNKLDRLFLYSNDYDFIPLCGAIKTMGANINLIRLTETRVNNDLVSVCDGFHSFTADQIDNFFEA